MKAYAKSVLFSLLLCTAAACGDKDDVNPDVTPANVTFLKVGTHWEFDVKGGFWEGQLMMDVEKELSKDTFLVRNTTDMNLLPLQYYVLKEGNLYTSYRHRDPDTYQIECKFGKPVGTTWQVKKFGVPYTYTIDSVNATVKSGRGVVTDAIKVQMKHNVSNKIGYQYISPSVGLLGDGNFGGTSTMQLKDYTVSTSASTAETRLPISFGDFAFMKVGNFWRYTLSTFEGDDVLKIEILSKNPSQNIYKIKITTESGSMSVVEYWYEDQGRLMVYEEGETLRQADPIYIADAHTKLGHGWVGTTAKGTTFIYKVSAINTPKTTFYGELPSMSVDVSNSLFSVQTNHWNKDKGLVLVDGGFISQDIISTNVRKAERPQLPFCGY